jgi:hypothetical protein
MLTPNLVLELNFQIHDYMRFLRILYYECMFPLIWNDACNINEIAWRRLNSSSRDPSE